MPTDRAQRLQRLSPEKRAALLKALRQDSGVERIARRPPGGAPAPASFAQQRLWLLDRLVPGNPAYNVPLAVRLAGRLQVQAMARALEEVVRRHEVLRTALIEGEDGPLQVVAPARPVPLPVVDLEGLSAAARGIEIERRFREEAQRPFDLARGPLLRVALLRLGAEEYILLLDLHHAVTDGWSTAILLDEIAALYAAHGTDTSGRLPELPELPIQYGDYAVWQRQWLQGGNLSRLLDYWRRQLAGAPAVLELPADRPQAGWQAVTSRRGGVAGAAVPAATLTALERLCRERGATLSTAVLAAFQALLGRHAGVEDLLVGSVAANRSRSETERLIGFFTNTLVLRGDLSGDPELAELLDRTHRVTTEAYDHAALPFERLVEELRPERPERSIAENPLFQVLYVFQNAPQAALSMPGLTLTPVDLYGGIAKFDLTLSAEPRGGGLQLWLEYSRERFERATAERLLGHLGNLLEAMAAAPGTRLSALPLFGESERHQLLVEWNANAGAVPSEICLHEAFEAQAARTPAAGALVAGDLRLTYAELNRRANRLAHHLRALGVGPEVRVGVSMERSAEMVVSLLAVLKAGGAYVPLDPAYPRERLDLMREDSGARVVLTREDVASAAGPESDPQPWAVPGNLAYLIYTSGSTGRPKAVAIEHRSAAALVDWARGTFGPEELAGVLAATSIAFDLSVFEIFAPLACGGRVILAENALELPRLPAAAAGEITLVNTVPSAMAELVRAGGLPASVVTVNLAGEPIPPALVPAIYAAPGMRRLYNLYGPSEDTTYSTFALLEPEGEVSIGRPVAGTRAHLLDRAGAPVPLGAHGELYLGGAGLARGYLGRPELTAERFVPDPFAAEPGGRLYRTGDLARRWSDGRLDFLGRLDHQVKVRGFRIELGEVEAALGRHPDVREAAVLARAEPGGDGGSGRRLVAYVVAREGIAVEPAGLRALLRDSLPEHMVPADYVALAALPLSPNGKVDRRALTLVEPAAHASAGSVAPRTPAEELLAGIWQELLGIERVGIHDDFFALGGHSLLAARAASRVSRLLGVEVTLGALFQAPTVAGLARFATRLEAAGDTVPPIQPVLRGGRLPLSFAQERLWVLDRFEPGTSAYNIAAALRLRGDLDRAALHHALARVVARHESLRTTFEAVDGEPAQRIAPPFRPELPVVDLSALAESARQGEADRWLRAVAETSFDLARGPLVRFLLLRTAHPAHPEHLLLLANHHIIFDGWSVGVLVREVGAAYAARLRRLQDAEPDLPALPVQYADFAVWQRQRLVGDLLERQLAYWRGHLADAPAGLELPADRARPAVRTFRGGRQALRVAAPLAGRLRSLSRSHGATLFMTLLAAFATLLRRLSGQTDVVVGTPAAGRGQVELEDLIGIFLNTLVLRNDLSGNPTFSELLGRVRETTLGAYAHQDVPFEKLLEELRPERDLSRTPFFQVFFNMLNFPEVAIELPGLAAELLVPPEIPAKFDLTVYAAEEGSELSFDLVYNAGLFSSDRMAELARQYESLLAQVAERPDLPVEYLSLVTPAAAALLPDPRAALGDAWVGAVHDRFAAEARRAPGRTAVVDRHESWTYGELAGRVDDLARALAACGIGPGGVVAIYAQRSARLVWAVMGVMRTGATFTVLDPAHPPARLIDCLRLAEVRGWIELEAAGPVPPALAEFVAEACPCRLALPAAPAPPTVLIHVGRGEGGGALSRASARGRDGEGSSVEDREKAPSPTLPRFAGQGAPAPTRLESAPMGEAGRPAVGPDDTAYIAFTSGSTGVPKGIQGRHGPLSHFLPWQRREFDLRESDRFSMLSGLSHDPLQRDIFTPLQLGAAVYVPDPAEIAVPGKLAEWMLAEGITVAHLTPAMGQLLTELPPGAAPLRLERLRYAFFVGDLLTRRDVARLSELAPAVACVNFYGSTETQRAVGYHRVRGGGAERVPAFGAFGKENLPLGRGIEDVQLLVLNPNDGLAGVGELGEIHVRSPHLAAGYLGDPQATGQRFVANPFTSTSGDRLYRTGDLGRYRPDGEVEFAGRVDFQVKIRGFRIEPGEIEAQLARHPAVREGLVLARDGAGGEKRLVAYVVPHPGRAESPTAGELRSYLKDALPDYMVPAAFVVLSRLPLTPNGKIDRRALPEPAEDRRESEAYIEPHSEAERAIAAVLRDVLRVEKVGVHDNFFELGGNSLLLVRIHARLRELLGQEIQVVDLFSHPTVGSLAAYLSRAQGAAAAGAPSGERVDKIEAGQSRLRMRLQQRQQAR